QQLASTQGRVIEDVAVLVRTDVGVQEPEFAVFHNAVRVFEIGVPSPDRFDLGSGQNDTSLKFFQQEIVMGSDPIDGCIPLTRSGWVAARIFLRVGFGLVYGGPGHGSKATLA